MVDGLPLSLCQMRTALVSKRGTTMMFLVVMNIAVGLSPMVALLAKVTALAFHDALGHSLG
jgi:hypothetical protein